MDFSFNLPFRLLLPDGEYPVKISSEKTVKLKLELRTTQSFDEKMEIRGLTYADLEDVKQLRIFITDNDYQGDRGPIIPANEIWNLRESGHIAVFVHEDSKKDKAPRIPIYFNSEIPKDRLGRFRYTRLTLLGEPAGDLMKVSITAVNKLIDFYRILTGEYWIKHVKESDVLAYSSERGGGGFGPTVWAQPPYDEKIVSTIKRFLLTDTAIPIHFTLFCDAEDATDQEDYALSIIYSITALESVAKQFLDTIPSNDPLRIQYAKALEEPGPHFLVTVLFPKKISNTELTPELIEQFKISNRKRNDIIHETRFDVIQKDAKDAFEVAKKISDVLLEKMRSQRLNRTSDP